MGATLDNMANKKNGISMNMNAIKGENGSTIFYLESKSFNTEGF